MTHELLRVLERRAQVMLIEREGVAAVNKVIGHMGLIFREQPTSDYGIDAQIETIENGYATGRLIAVQIKSGNSYFDETNENGIVYRGDRTHYRYWINHSLPVIIVLYNPQDDMCYWQVINKETAELTEKGWKTEIPFSNQLDRAKHELKSIADRLTEYEKRFNSFLLAKPWMDEIVNENQIVLNVDEWVNKSSGRGDFKLRIIDKYGNEQQVFERSFIGFGLKPYTEVLEELFPWARIRIDADFYADYDEEAFTNQDFEAALQTYPDINEQRLSSDPFECDSYVSKSSVKEWMNDENNIRPYEIAAGEVARYQLVLELNEVAKAFLLFDDFISNQRFYTLDESILN